LRFIEASRLGVWGWGREEVAALQDACGMLVAGWPKVAGLLGFFGAAPR
jgi:hypothetical protein